MVMTADNHLTGDELERYFLRTLPEPEAELAEEHLLACRECQDRTDEAAAYVEAMRQALAELRLHPEPRRRAWLRSALRPAPLAAAAALAALALVAGGGWRLAFMPSRAAPAVVVLEAARGPSAAHGPARAPLSLRLDGYGLPEFPGYRVQVVDAAGRAVFDRDAAAAGGSITVPAPALRAGTYWVRVYGGGELLREYGLELK